MVLDVGVVGGALERDVERNLQAQVMGRLHEPVECLDAAQLGVDAFVPALRSVLQKAADGPRTARVAGGGFRGIVLAFAVGFADGMDRGKVDDIEAHLLDARQPLRGLVERGVPLVVPGGAREELVPRAGPGPLRVHEDFVGRTGRLLMTRRVAAHEFSNLVPEGRLRVAVLEGLDVGLQHLPVVFGRVFGGLAEQRRPGGQLALDLGRRLAALHPAPKLILPRGEAVDPGPHAV